MEQVESPFHREKSGPPHCMQQFTERVETHLLFLSGDVLMPVPRTRPARPDDATQSGVRSQNATAAVLPSVPTPAILGVQDMSDAKGC
jgi:hypothetical protein